MFQLQGSKKTRASHALKHARVLRVCFRVVSKHARGCACHARGCACFARVFSDFQKSDVDVRVFYACVFVFFPSLMMEDIHVCLIVGLEGY